MNEKKKMTKNISVFFRRKTREKQRREKIVRKMTLTEIKSVEEEKEKGGEISLQFRRIYINMFLRKIKGKNADLKQIKTKNNNFNHLNKIPFKNPKFSVK